MYVCLSIQPFKIRTRYIFTTKMQMLIRMAAGGRHFNEICKILFLLQKLFLAKSRAYFLLLVMDGRHKVVFSIMLIHFGFLKLKERMRVESCEQAGRGLALRGA